MLYFIFLYCYLKDWRQVAANDLLNHDPDDRWLLARSAELINGSLRRSGAKPFLGALRNQFHAQDHDAVDLGHGGIVSGHSHSTLRRRYCRRTSCNTQSACCVPQP
jgi:hypothetical protein